MSEETVTSCNALKPERSRTFLEIVVSYPAFCTYPEYEGKPYYAIKFEENGETIVGFGTYNPRVLSQYLQEYFLPSAEPERKKGEWEEGEWIMHKMLSRDYGKIYYQHDCSCNLYESPYPFCPNCGMKMKRGDR